MAAITENNGSSACNPLFHCKPEEEEEEEEGGDQKGIVTREGGKEETKKTVQKLDNKTVEIVSFVWRSRRKNMMKKKQ